MSKCDAQQSSENTARHGIKCLVWDLDNTLWDGTLLEDDEVFLKPEAEKVIRTLDARGILQSIASRNDSDLAIAKLREFGLEEFFLFPQIGWGAKSTSIKAIADAINISVSTLAFIDDQAFERDEVTHVFSEVLCIDANNLGDVLALPATQPSNVTLDAKRRRLMYIEDIERKNAEECFSGVQIEFNATLNMSLAIAPARMEDMGRAEELTQRTNQLNTTGYSYSIDELNEFASSDQHHLWMVRLEDRYGSYGSIGLVLIDVHKDRWVVRLFLMSCRVMNRGIGSVVIHQIRSRAKQAGVRLMAEMITNDRNRMMYATFKFTHFKEINRQGDLITLENDLAKPIVFPEHIDLKIE